MDQQQLFFVTYYEALRDDAQACGFKDIAFAMFPEKLKPEAAARALADKLNPERRERLTDEQERLIMRLAREKRGFSSALAYICEETGFERPKAIRPEDTAQILIERAETLARESRAIAVALERLARAPIQSVK